MSDTALLPSFSTALTQEAVEGCIEPYPADYIIEHLLTLSSYLIDLVGRTNFFGKHTQDTFSPSLRTLHDRLQNGQFGPSLLDSQFLSEERIKARTLERTGTPAAQRALADFEDLYYALIGRMKDMHQLLNMRIKSGFNEVSAPVFEGGPTITDLHESLYQYWSVLNEPAWGKALDDAIRQAKAEVMHHEIIFRVQKNEISPAEAEDDIARLWDQHLYSGIQGLCFINGFAPAMIAATLEQKYRVVLRLEKEEAQKKARQEKRQAKVEKKVNFSRDHSTHMGAQKVDKNAHIKVDHRVQDLQKQEHVQYPANHENVVDGRLQQSLEHERAQQEQIHRALEWQMKSQRVSEYRSYLRGRASQGARAVIQSTHGSDAMSSFQGIAQNNANGHTTMDQSEG
ncbi:Nn.00g036610.m01.CDS01 [Neocucurbitaria sp. VM-36]